MTDHDRKRDTSDDALETHHALDPDEAIETVGTVEDVPADDPLAGRSSHLGGWAVLRRGFAMSPALSSGIGLTILLSILGTAGGALVPVVIQRAIDGGLSVDGDVDVEAITLNVLVVGVVLVLVAVVGYWSKVRIFTAAETGLADLRVAAFRHVHDLSMLTQNTQRRGGLVSRVTSDIDQISQFISFTGMLMIVSVGQMLVATIVMALLS